MNFRKKKKIYNKKKRDFQNKMQIEIEILENEKEKFIEFKLQEEKILNIESEKIKETRLKMQDELKQLKFEKYKQRKNYFRK